MLRDAQCHDLLHQAHLSNSSRRKIRHARQLPPMRLRQSLQPLTLESIHNMGLTRGLVFWIQRTTLATSTINKPNSSCRSLSCRSRSGTVLRFDTISGKPQWSTRICGVRARRHWPTRRSMSKLRLTCAWRRIYIGTKSACWLGLRLGLSLATRTHF